jgi:exosortase
MAYFPQVETLVDPTVHPGVRWRLSQYGILAALIGWLYSPILFRLAVQWHNDPNYSYGFLVPAFSMCVLWRDRSRLSKVLPRPSGSGLFILILGMATLIVGVLGSELFLSRFSLLLVIAGLVIFFGGWRCFRIVLFPWAFLLLMIPIPAIILTRITFPLQILASSIAAEILQFLGVPALREGNIIILPNFGFEVAEACSGIRSLFALMTFAIIYGFLSDTRTHIRVALALASVPIAVAANSLRIVITGLLAQCWNASKAQGFFHEFSGWVVFLLSLALLAGLHRLLWPVEAQRSVV